MGGGGVEIQLSEDPRRSSPGDGPSLPGSFCTLPTRLAGIQDTTPLAWSPDGTTVAFVAGNRTVFLSRAPQNAAEHRAPPATTQFDPRREVNVNATSANPAGAGVGVGVGGPQAPVPAGASSAVTLAFEPLGYLVGHKDPVAGLAFHPAGEILATVSAEGIFLWDALELSSGSGSGKGPGGGSSMLEPFRKFGCGDSRDAHEGAVECCHWLAEGTALATGGRDGAIKLWDTEAEFGFIDTLHAHKAAVLFIEHCAATDILATAGRDSTIFIWDIRPLAPENRAKRLEDASYKVGQLYRIDGHRGDIVSLTFSRDGDVLYSGARDNEIKVWNVSSTKEMMSIGVHKGDVNGLQLMNKDALLLTGAADGTVKLFDMGKVPSLLRVTENFVAEDVNDLLEQEEALVSPEKVKADLVMSCRAHERDVQRMAVNPKIPLMATSSSQSCVRIWNIRDLSQPVMVHEFVGHDDDVAAVKFVHGDQHFLSGSSDYQVFLYDATQLRRIAALPCAGSVHCLATNPSEDIVFAGSTDYAIRAFDIAPGRSTTFGIVASFEGHAGKVSALAVSRDGAWLFSAGYDFDILVWPLADVRGGGDPGNPAIVSPKNKIDAHTGRVTGLAFNASGDRLVSVAVDHGIVLWAVNGPKISRVWRGENAHDASVECCAFGRASTADTIITGSLDHKIKLWDSADLRGRSGGSPLVTLSGHSGRVTAVEASRDGATFASTSADGTARLWRLQGDFACLAEYDCLNDGPVTCVAVGNNSFLTGSQNSMIRLWPLPTQENQQLFTRDKPKPRSSTSRSKNGKGKQLLVEFDNDSGGSQQRNEAASRGKEPASSSSRPAEHELASSNSASNSSSSSGRSSGSSSRGGRLVDVEYASGRRSSSSSR